MDSPKQSYRVIQKICEIHRDGYCNEIEDKSTLSAEEIRLIHAYWRAANYLAVGQIYLLDNPLLKQRLAPEHCKSRLLGHWGTTPGLNFIYVHLNRMIKQRDSDVLYVAGPGHGGPAIVANVYLEGTYSEIYPNVSQDERGLKRLMKQFSFPGGIPSHVAPETPGSIHEGGELGYALSHAYGAAFDNPNLIVACVVGDGEAETGPTAAAWHSNKFLNPARDGAVLPILHLNGYKIASPTIFARISDQELEAIFLGYGYMPFIVQGSDPHRMHVKMASTLDKCFDIIAEIQGKARCNFKPRTLSKTNGDGNKATSADTIRSLWPMIVLRTPKGWTGVKEVDGLKTEGSWRSHQVPIAEVRENHAHRALLEAWMKSYRPEELFDAEGRLVDELRALAPVGSKRMGSSPYSNPGVVRDLILPVFQHYAFKFTGPGSLVAESPRGIGNYLRDVLKLNADAKNFRIFGPDETVSNRLGAVLEVENRTWMADLQDDDDHLSVDGRVMELLSEHTLEGWLEGYLLTGRHGFFSSYEAFIHLIDSMFNQHAKWLKVTSTSIPWRRAIASVNYFLTSHVWRQDHNGFSHQDPGFIDHVLNKKLEIVRVYLPPDGNTLLCVTDECLRSKNRINVIVAGKQPEFQWLSMDAAVIHCAQGLGIWKWASTDLAGEPEVVMACAGDVPTLETLAAVDLLKIHIPDLKMRFVNVVELTTLASPHTEWDGKHPRAVSDYEFDSIFTKDKPVIFAHHGYPALIHRLIYRRHNHGNFHVRGYREEGKTTTPFDMLVLNGLDRFHLAISVIDRVPRLQASCAHLRQTLTDKLVEHKMYIRRVGEDMPEVKDWQWQQREANI